MDRYFMKKYAMSEIGAKHLSKAIFSRTVLNSAIILHYLSMDMLNFVSSYFLF